MLVSTLQLAAIVVLVPSLASAAIFPKDTLVKMIDPKGFRQVMKVNQTSMVAFVAPWCGHCQRMAPEYSKAALGLHPLIPVYAVDCDADANKRLCAEQGVKGFPTVKLFPRGNELGSMTYESGERTANAFFYWASRRVPNPPSKLSEIEDITSWVEKTSNKHRALLLTKETKVPLLWKVLSNKYKGQLELGIHRDREGKSSIALGLEVGGKKGSKVLIYPVGSMRFVRYEGLTKLDSLSKFFDSVLDGTADLSALSEPSTAENIVPEEKELELEPELEKEDIQGDAETKAETEAPEASQVVLEDSSEQTILEHHMDEVEKPAENGGQPTSADGPGAKASAEYDSPATSMRPADEL